MQTNFILFYVTVMLLLGASVISKNTYTIEEAGFPVIVSLYVGMGFRISARSRVLKSCYLLYSLSGQRILVHIYLDDDLVVIN